MKLYHPSAHVVDQNNNLMGFVIHKGSQTGMGIKAPSGELAHGVDMDTFKQLVSANAMQLFQMTEHGPEVKYTQEELRVLKKHQDTLLTGEDYFNNDVKFNYNDIFLGQEWNGVAMSICGMMKMLGKTVVHCVIYRHWPFTPADIKIFKKYHATVRRLADNLYMVSFLIDELIKLLLSRTYIFGINYIQCLNMESILYKKTPPNKRLSQGELQSAVYCIQNAL